MGIRGGYAWALVGIVRVVAGSDEEVVTIEGYVYNRILDST